MARKRIFLDMDGTLAEWRAAAQPHELYQKGYFESLKPQKRLVACIRFLLLTGLSRLLRIDFYILTSYLADSEYAKPEKIVWTKKEIPELADKMIFVPYGKPKSDYVGQITKNDYLLDDYKVNLEGWNGTSIKYLNGINSDWDGPSVRHNSKTLVFDLLKIVLAR